MNNTFWTIINKDYYRVKDNELYTAPILNDEVDTDKSSKVVSIITNHDSNEFDWILSI
jgi:hypothetical protein